MDNSKTKVKSVAFYERGSWYHRYKELEENGTIKYSKKGGFTTQEQAEESYYIYEERFKKQQQNNSEAILNKEVMFKDYLVYWLENIYKSRVEKTSYMVASYAIYNLIKPNIEYDVKLRFVTTEYLDALILKASKLTASAGETTRLIIGIALKDGMLQGLLSSNPIKNTKPYPRMKPKVRILNKKQLKIFLKCAKETNWYLEILLGVFCGLRKGEILALKIDDINFDNETITINRQLVANPKIENGSYKIVEYNLIERNPKTENSYRRIKIPKIVINEIKKRIDNIEIAKEKYGEKYNDNNYLSCQEDGARHGLASLNTTIRRICVKNNLPLISPHSLRHMFATILLELGVSLPKISGLLGHQSIHTTFECYCEIMDEKDKILAFMNNIYEAGREN